MVRASMENLVASCAGAMPSSMSSRARRRYMRRSLAQPEDQRTRVEVRLAGGTVWLTQVQLAELYLTSVPNVNIHLTSIYEDGESRQ